MWDWAQTLSLLAQGWRVGVFSIKTIAIYDNLLRGLWNNVQGYVVENYHNTYYEDLIKMVRKLKWHKEQTLKRKYYLQKRWVAKNFT